MKKMVLLVTMVCAGQLYGMGDMSKLPKEVQVLVIQALNSGKDIDATINAIKTASRTSKALNQMINEQYNYNNLKGFDALVDVFAKKFPALSHRLIAEKFNTPISKKYVEINSVCTWLLVKLKQDKDERDFAKAKELIRQGEVDPNYKEIPGGRSILDIATVLKDEGKPSYIEIFNLLKAQ
jgi:hypothetical protein